jgi:hypothetical protein
MVAWMFKAVFAKVAKILFIATLMYASAVIRPATIKVCPPSLKVEGIFINSPAPEALDLPITGEVLTP